jgi:hypothetical protein
MQAPTVVGGMVQHTLVHEEGDHDGANTSSYKAQQDGFSTAVGTKSHDAFRCCLL